MKKPIRTKKAIEADYRTKALHAGKRTSEEGNVYYESRPNRSDVNRTTKLAEGGDLSLSKEDIKAAIEKYKRGLVVAEKHNATAAVNLAKTKIADLEKQLEEAEKAPEKKVEVVKAKPKKAAMPVKKEKPVVKAKLPVKKVVKASVPVAKKKEEVKAVSKVDKSAKEKKFVTINNVKYYEDSKEFCDALNIAWNKRQSDMKKANKKYKTKTISERIGGDIASTTIKVIEHIADIKEKQIAANPKLYIAKFEKLEDSANLFAKSIKDLLGTEYDNSEVKAELEDIEKAIDKIKNKLKK